MNLKSIKKMLGKKKAKLNFFGFVFILVFSFLCLNSMKVSAVTESSAKIEILQSIFNKDGDSDLDGDDKFDSVSLSNGTSGLTFIQGNGKDGEVAVLFKVTNFPTNIKSFVIIESNYSDSSDNADMDKYKKDVDGNWCVEVTAEDGKVTCESETTAVNMIKGKAEFSEDGTEAQIVYRLRSGSYGLKFFKIFFFSGEITNEKPASEATAVFVNSRPIDKVDQATDLGTTCSSETEKICTDYVEGATSTRISRKLKIYVPETVAYNFVVEPLKYTFDAANNNNIVNNYQDVQDNGTIYAINYFKEEANSITPANKDGANRAYLYTEFALAGNDSQAVTNSYLTGIASGKNYTYYLNSFTANGMSYIETSVDATGRFHYYIKDIFGNIKVITQDVTDVKNRAIIVEMKKGNSSTTGYNATETFTGESVKVELKMTVETHFEYGVCVIAGKCSEITNLNKNNVKTIKYWRVDASKLNEDEYVSGMAATVDYADQSYAATDTMYDLFCGTGSTDCSATEYDVNKSKLVTGHGSDLDEFTANVFVMYIATNGRYRFYIEDTSGNNTEGSDTDRIEGEYRNPRVEVYAIDKAAPEISFEEHSETETVGGTVLTEFNIETCKYYQGLELISVGAYSIDCGDIYEYDGTTDEEDVTKIQPINGVIYYPYNRDAGRESDVSFTDAMAILLSKVKVSEYQYSYSGAKTLFSDYSVYGRENGSKYIVVDGVKNDITIIANNIQHNSNGLKAGENFAFYEINYYHHNGTTNTVCEKVNGLGGDFASYTDKLDCLNYYIDHAIDFIIEFKAEDVVGNIGVNRVYVDMVDTTPPGFRLHYKEVEGEVNPVIDTEKLVKTSNIGTNCRMEIGQSIGKGTNQDMLKILECYNIDLGGTIGYNFEDNDYGGLSFANNINDVSHVKLYMKSDEDADGNTSWINLCNDDGCQTFVPNKTGYYDMKIVISDAANNELSVIVSYFVDRKIVLIKPLANSKLYGDSDPTLHYCVYIDVDNDNVNRYKANPYEDLSVFDLVYCTNEVDEIADGNKTVFQENDSKFGGALSRLESIWYNNYVDDYVSATTSGVENNYVGLYKIILGSLNIFEADGETPDDDYIIKMYSSEEVRDVSKYTGNGLSGVSSDNSITTKALEDDDPLTQSLIVLTIKQVLLEVTANGGEKDYGQKDTGWEDYNNDGENSYLGGVTVDNGLQYTDTASVVQGVLRRENGENVGTYGICNYRGTDLNDNVLETSNGGKNNVYVGCSTVVSSDLTLAYGGSYADGDYVEGILSVGADYIKSRALYIVTNKTTAGKTINVTSDTRNNNYANYVIVYNAGSYVINSIDLVIQVAPGQRREYNYSGVEDPNPWEIILYGLVDGTIKKDDNSFNGYTQTILTDEDHITEDGLYYSASANDSDSTGVNASETRETWKLYHNGIQLTGYKTNETYYLLRNTASSSNPGGAKVVREGAGLNQGGWYLYYELDTDLNVVTSGSASAAKSKVAVMTNGRSQCAYDTTGHIVSVGGEALCKNYNLVYNQYYTDAEGYTVANRKEGSTADAKGIYQSYVYQSNGASCLTADPDLPCEYVASESDPTKQKIYMIQYEIYRREIILEFNSALETIITKGADGATESWNIFYGKRYDYYKDNLFDFVNTTISPEGYLFLCYQNMDKTKADLSNGGCTSTGTYGLTSGDTWANVGIYFKMHGSVSNSDSAYYDSDTDKAIPAGAYYIYSDIKEEQKKNYNYKYLGGTLTIKSKPVKIIINSYSKEYGEKYYSYYGSGYNYSDFKALDACLLDGYFLTGASDLIDLGEGVYCTGTDIDATNKESVTYGFIIDGLDSLDTILGNFVGRPIRDRNTALNADANGLQDDVGTYTLKDVGGNARTIKTVMNNPFYNGVNSVCDTQGVLKDANDGLGACVVRANKGLDNYAVEAQTYEFNLVGEANAVASQVTINIPQTEVGYVLITPATLKITVTSGQNKMYGCAYNAVNVNGSYKYSYTSGYSTTDTDYISCVEGDEDYYDLGYEFTVSGDKDYQIAKNGYEYESNDSYTVSGKNRPTIENKKGLKDHALNGGTLYRIPWSSYFNGEDGATNGIKMSAYVSAAMSAQKPNAGNVKTYQGQVVGKYVITLGDVDATENAPGVAGGTYTNACDGNNMPNVDGKFACKNYHINYYNTSVNEDVDNDAAQKYTTAAGAYPTDLTFEITKRTVYVYTSYDRKIYGDADIYNDSSKAASYMCGDYNMDGKIDEDDNLNGVNGDVHNGFCTQAQVDANKEEEKTYINYGLTRYYTKYNSLAKAPWNGLATRNDVQTDVISGQISRRGMNDQAPTTDDFRGFYKYVYNDNDDQNKTKGVAYGGTVALTDSYGASNYAVNFYNASGDAVGEDGESTMTFDGKTVDIKYEIVLRQIQIAFVSFDKVYGERDDVVNYNILVCAPTETFDFATMKCINKQAGDEHGLSESHLEKYVVDGKLKQSDFKNDFVVRFIRVLGENVVCSGSSIDVELNGYFFGADSEVFSDGTVYKKTLSCSTEYVDDKTVYETLAYIDQSAGQLGYNYQVSYTIGYLNILPRPILITPDANQGFVYGDYDDVLIPHITFTDSVVSGDNIKETYGLVHGSDNQGVCLNNINYYNKETSTAAVRVDKTKGDCFNINDRKDEYESNLNTSTSKYDSSAVKKDYGLTSINVKNYVFGDEYDTSDDSSRNALDRKIGTTDKTRYNRNVGTYEITLGDLVDANKKDKTGNYVISFTTGVEYKITSANVVVTPDDDDFYNKTFGTTHKGQYKIYGEQDKELTFTVLTTYTVSKTHYAKYNQNIKSVCPLSGNCKTINNIRYTLSNGTFEQNAAGDYMLVEAGDTITLNGFAYDENVGSDNHLNYGKTQGGKKNGVEDSSVSQSAVKESYYYDKVCLVGPTVGCNTSNELSYGSTSRILLGYLHVENYSQAAGVYNIVSGFKVAVNEFANNNYSLQVVNEVKFTIIPRPIGIKIEDITKTYGQTTDVISCDAKDKNGNAITCSIDDGILMAGNTYLKYNFDVVAGSTAIQTIVGSNNKLYSTETAYAIGMVPASQSAYSAHGLANNVGEDKNSNHLGVYVSRDERNTSNNQCMYDGDKFGFCEDVGVYSLRLYGYLNTIDSITANDYQTVYKPGNPGYTGLVDSVAQFYYSSYFGYNPNYFVVVVKSDGSPNGSPLEADELFEEGVSSTDRVKATEGAYNYDKVLTSTATLTIIRKKVALYVNTYYFEEGKEIYSIAQNTRAPNLPQLNESIDFNYNLFHGIDPATGTIIPDNVNKRDAVSDTASYGKVIWGTKPNKVRTGDKLTGTLAYCNKILNSESLIVKNYACDSTYYKENPADVHTHLEGYIPIIRGTAKLSITNASATEASATYESKNYDSIFYPGVLKIVQDDTKPVVQVNRNEVYIEANAIGTYFYECVGFNKTTTYKDCNIKGTEYSIVGKTSETVGDPILKWLTVDVNKSLIIKGELPTLDTCSADGVPCTSSAYFQKTHGKEKDDFANKGGILSGSEATHVYPFTLESKDNVNNSAPSSFAQMINTLVDWFGVTAYDQSEIRIDPITGNKIVLDKVFDKYWYIIIEENGTNGAFDISKVGKYKVHFYVMDNAGNVSEGNMYQKNYDEDGNLVSTTIQTTYSNVGTLNIIDTTKPIVGTLNLYNGPIECKYPLDCTKEESWTVAQDTYVPINTLLRYSDSAGANFSLDGTYVDIGGANLELLENLDKYSRSTSASGVSYSKDNAQGRYVLIAKGNNARALKHYSWSNSSSGIYLTITGGSDNSYTNVVWKNYDGSNYRIEDTSQWNYYYSRDGGITWVLYERGYSYIALDEEGSREILIKAVDKGVKFATNDGVVGPTDVTYTKKYYGENTGIACTSDCTGTISKYTFKDTSVHDDWLKEFDLMSDEDKKAKETERHTAVANVGWNISDAGAEDGELSERRSQMLYGLPASSENPDVTVSGYKHYKDKATAYLDRTAPIIGFGTANGTSTYIYEFGCETCTNSYVEKWAGATDSYPEGTSSAEISLIFDKSLSIFINHALFDSTKGQEGSKYQTSYENVSTEQKGSNTSTNISSGLGGNYSMTGLTSSDIRNVSSYERRYVIYEFNETTGERNVYDLSSLIPTHTDSTKEDYELAEAEIYKYIKEITKYTSDYSYQIVYSVFDKAGNESVYITRAILFLNLIPTINAATGGSTPANIVQVDQNTYSLVVKQGEDATKLANDLVIDAGRYSNFLTQTIYYNGELVVNNSKYNGGVYEEFNTSVPGVYEIIYNAKYMHYDKNGMGELIEADPIRLTITVESTTPIVEATQSSNNNHLVMIIGILFGIIFVGAFGFIVRKKEN